MGTVLWLERGWGKAAQLSWPDKPEKARASTPRRRKRSGRRGERATKGTCSTDRGWVSQHATLGYIKDAGTVMASAIAEQAPNPDWCCRAWSFFSFSSHPLSYFTLRVPQDATLKGSSSWGRDPGYGIT